MDDPESHSEYKYVYDEQNHRGGYLSLFPRVRVVDKESCYERDELAA